MTKETHCLVLMSGGIDSSATLVACQQPGTYLSGMFVDYGQPAAESEWKASESIANHYHFKIDKVELGASLVSNSGEFFGRNALFILTAAGTISHRPLTIALGIHALADYYDTTPLFVRHIQRLLNGYSGGSVNLSVPFLTYTKAEVVQFAKDNSVPLHLTYSCERRNAPACAECPSCLDRISLNAG